MSTCQFPWRLCKGWDNAQLQLAPLAQFALVWRGLLPPIQVCSCGQGVNVCVCQKFEGALPEIKVKAFPCEVSVFRSPFPKKFANFCHFCQKKKQVATYWCRFVTKFGLSPKKRIKLLFFSKIDISWCYQPVVSFCLFCENFCYLRKTCCSFFTEAMY